MKWLLQSGRTRHRRNRRALALWLIAAQILLYAASSLAHAHPEHESDSADRAAVACPAGRGAHLHTVLPGDPSAPVHCRLCEAARSLIAGLALRSSIGAAEPIVEAFTLPSVLTSPNPVSRRHPPRAPPAC
jgi:hypothetical protein